MEAKHKKLLTSAVRHFWTKRSSQASRQKEAGKVDQGNRGAVTGGAQMDGFISLFQSVLGECGLKDDEILVKRKLELPGYYRATKEWDLLAIRDKKLLAAFEVKSQVGSFGNNFNNRSEEAIGSAEDLWIAHREGAFGVSSRPWLGFVFLLEDCEGSRSPVSVAEPNYPVSPEFRDASYAKRYEILFRKLLLERKYDAIAYLTSASDTGLEGRYNEPSRDQSIEMLLRSLEAHVNAYK